MIGELENEVEKSHWLKKIANELDVRDIVLTEELKKVKLGERIPTRNRNQAADEFFQIINRQKIDILLEELVGLLLAIPGSWESLAVKKEYDSAYFFRNNILRLMLERGNEFSFCFNEFIDGINREFQLEAEKLFFRKKFRLGLNNELEEVSLEELKRELSGILAEIEEKIKKDKRIKVEKDLALAEKRMDKIAKNLLLKELKDLSKI